MLICHTPVNGTQMISRVWLMYIDEISMRTFKNHVGTISHDLMRMMESAQLSLLLFCSVPF